MFSLTIKSGNAAMQKYSDLAKALRKLADQIGNDEMLTQRDNGSIRDDNGNIVGEWKVK